MQTVIYFLHSFFDSLLNSRHHLMAYLALIAVLLISIPLMRLIFGSRRAGGDDTSLQIASPSMLGLTSPAVDFNAAPIQFARKPPSSVTAIHESRTVPCIHCGVTMPSRQDFCPTCGYAQPAKQSFSA
jgi:hypothetical protein